MTAADNKNLKIGIGIAAAAGLVYFLTKGGAPNGGYEVDPTGNGGVTNPGNGTSTSVFDPAKIANALYEAMRYPGTDDEEIISVLRTVSQAQFGQVVQKFGARQYNATMGNQMNYNPFTQLPFKNLAFWLKNELTTQDYNLLRLKYPNYL